MAHVPDIDLTAGEQRYLHTVEEKVARWTEDPAAVPERSKSLRFAPELFAVLCRLSRDPELTPEVQNLAMHGVVYFLNPADILPDDNADPAGLLDDVVFAALVLLRLEPLCGADTLRSWWRGDGDVVAVMTDLAAHARDLLGAGRSQMLENMAASLG